MGYMVAGKPKDQTRTGRRTHGALAHARRSCQDNRMLRTAAATVVLWSLSCSSSSSAMAESEPLDMALDGSASALAKAAGACGKQQPAVLRTWCREGPAAKSFVATFEITKVVAAPSLKPPTVTELMIAPRELGKGYVLAPGQPPIVCEDQSCRPGELVLKVTTPKPLPPDVKLTLRVRFRSTKLWRDQAYWGPTLKITSLEILDATGATVSAARLRR
jgi:hypothetical protein